jgi:hypothetical protein
LLSAARAICAFIAANVRYSARTKRLSAFFADSLQFQRHFFLLLEAISFVILSEARLQRSPESFRGEARLSISDLFESIPPRETDQRCLKAWPHALHFAAALHPRMTVAHEGVESRLCRFRLVDRGDRDAAYVSSIPDYSKFTEPEKTFLCMDLL